jgi:hypothetical protein
VGLFLTFFFLFFLLLLVCICFVWVGVLGGWSWRRGYPDVAERRVFRSVAACRGVKVNNIGGELPAQYSALTQLRSWCAIRSDPGGCSERLWLLHRAGGRRKLAGMRWLVALAQRCRLGPGGLRRHTQRTMQCETICILQHATFCALALEDIRTCQLDALVTCGCVQESCGQQHQR